MGVLAIVVALGLCGRGLGEEGPNPLALEGPKPAPVETPKPADIEAAIRRGVDFLVARQNKDGSWGNADITRPSEVYAPVPGAHQAFRTATTALCISALIETGGKRPEVESALDRAEAWMFENVPHLRRATPDALYNSWGHAYALDALAHMLRRKPDDQQRKEKIGELIRGQIDRLQRYEVVDGGWAYYDMAAHTQKPSGTSIPFVTATVLVAFDEVKRAGFEIPPKLIKRAVDSIRRDRKPDYSYCYGEYLKYEPMFDINLPGGSLGRSQACNLAMRLWGDKTVTDGVLKTWLDRLFARNLWLDLGRKRPIPHESWYHVAAYFFYYGHYYAALCIDALPRDERGPYQDHLAHVLLRLQEKDGSWWDFPLYDYHQQYGTAFALMSLVRCKRQAAD